MDEEGVTQPAAALVSIGQVSAMPAELARDAVQWLSPPEHRQYLGLTTPKRRMQFLAGRWWARHTLARYAGGDWQAYALSDSLDAGPRVTRVPDAAALHCSLSHSGDWLACVVASQPVGVDVEARSARQRDVSAMSEMVCSPAEQADLTALSGSLQARHFLGLWALKEAALKQLSSAGQGMPPMPTLGFHPGAYAKPTAPGQALAWLAACDELVLAVYTGQPPCSLRDEGHTKGAPALRWQPWLLTRLSA